MRLTYLLLSEEEVLNLTQSIPRFICSGAFHRDLESYWFAIDNYHRAARSTRAEERDAAVDARLRPRAPP